MQRLRLKLLVSAWDISLARPKVYTSYVNSWGLFLQTNQKFSEPKRLETKRKTEKDTFKYASSPEIKANNTLCLLPTPSTLPKNLLLPHFERRTTKLKNLPQLKGFSIPERKLNNYKTK